MSGRAEDGEGTNMADQRLSGKVALISGGARGMGLAHVRALTREGACVAAFDVHDVDEAGLAGIDDDRVLFLRADVRSASDWERVVDETLRRFGRLDTLVNNAGVVDAHRVDSASEDAYRRVIDINQVGVFLGMRSVVGPMRQAGRGSIINISSTAGLVGFVDNFAYVAAKWAVRGMTRAAALELAADGIRVNAVCPGEVDTPLLRADPTALPPESSRFGRWARPEEISAAVVFLASDESSYISGSDLVIDATHTAE